VSFSGLLDLRQQRLLQRLHVWQPKKARASSGVQSMSTLNFIAMQDFDRSRAKKHLFPGGLW
jgi:hypothetical protein